MKNSENQKAYISPFMNSFLRDYSHKLHLEQSSEELRLILNEHKKLIFKLDYYSITGIHHYSDQIILCDQNKESEITFIQAVELILNIVFSDIDTGDFLLDIKNSMANQIASMEVKKDFNKYANSYIESEQNLIYGHPVHPYPKLRDGFNQQDSKLYSPEFSNQFNLVWIKLHKDIVFTKKSKNFEFSEYEKLLNQEGIHNIDTDQFFLPMHPWQWKKLKENNSIKKYIKNKQITELNLGQLYWSPTSSTRALYNKGAIYGLKFSMDVRLTNSIRHLTLEESLRGIQLKDVFDSKSIAQSDLHILHEPAVFGIKDEHNKVIISTMVVLRENIHQLNTNTDQCYLLASLAERSANNHHSRLNTLVADLALKEKQEISAIVKRWFNQFLIVAIKPILNLADQYGILLGAHQQNLIISLKNGLPESCYFKDCQGSGFTLKGYKTLKQYSHDIDETNGNVLDELTTTKIFLYHLLSNTIYGLISTLSYHDNKVETMLLSDFRTFLLTEFKDVKEPTIIKTILNAKKLYHKANFKCCIERHNENTMSNPAQLYTEYDNPIITKLRPLSIPPKGELYSFYSKRLNATMSFRTFELERDLETFYRWQHQSFVQDFWEMAWNKERLIEYIQEVKKSPYKLPVMYQVNGNDVGYFEFYWAREDRIAPYCPHQMYDRGLHLLIGEEKYLRTQFVTNGILHSCKYMFESSPATQNIWGEPRVDNKKILKISEALPGWSFVREFDFPHKRSSLIVCNRDQFEQELTSWKM